MLLFIWRNNSTINKDLFSCKLLNPLDYIEYKKSIAKLKIFPIIQVLFQKTLAIELLAFEQRKIKLFKISMLKIQKRKYWGKCNFSCQINSLIFPWGINWSKKKSLKPSDAEFHFNNILTKRFKYYVEKHFFYSYKIFIHS